MNIRWMRWVTGCIAACAFGVVAAQTFPNRPVKLVVPFPPAGPTDTMARAIAFKLSAAMGQPFVVENKPGANTIIAADYVAKSPPDGHVLLMTNDSTYSINPLLYSKLPYNPKTDLAPVAAVAHLPECLIINGSLPVTNMKEFIAYAKANPGKLNYGSFGPGSSPHLAAEAFKAATGVDIVHVPYKGGAELQPALLSGQVHVMFASPNATLQHIRQGRLKALATYAPNRIAQLPDVPTYEEEGLKGLELHTWFGIFATGRTPPAVIKALADQIDKVVADPEFRNQRLVPLSFVPAPPGTEYFQGVLKADEARYRKFVQSANIRLD